MPTECIAPIFHIEHLSNFLKKMVGVEYRSNTSSWHEYVRELFVRE